VSIAKDVFGISEAVAKEINNVVDKGIVHDLGRRMPQEPTLFEEFFDPESFYKRSSRLTKVQGIIRSLLKDAEYTNTFFLHHAVDLLEPRLIAARITNTPIGKCGSNICEAVCREFRGLFKTWPSKSFLQEFASKFYKIVEHPDLRSWVDKICRGRLKNEKLVRIRDDLSSRILACILQKDKYGGLSNKLTFKNFPKMLYTIIEEKLREDMTRWVYGRMAVLVSKYAATYSHLIDYALLTPFVWETISSNFIRITRRKSAGLGRVALRACEDAEDEEEMRSRILRAASFYVDIYLRKYGIEPPQDCLIKYAVSFIEGFKIIQNVMENYCHM